MSSQKASPFSLLRQRFDSDLADGIELRAATRADVPAIEALHFLSVQGLGAGDYTAAQIELFLGQLGTYDPTLIDDGTYFVLVHGGHIVGSGGWSERMPKAHGPGVAGDEATARRFSLSPYSAKIRSVFVHPRYARLGLGARLVRHAEAGAAAAGHHLFELWSSLTGVPLYLRLGYQEIAPLAIPCGGGQGLPAVHMARLMAPAGRASAA